MEHGNGHATGGILGAMLTGVFAAPGLGGQGIYDYVANKISPDYDMFVTRSTGSFSLPN